MTYCIGIAVADGLVFVSDSRTNAGIDHISTHSKMHRYFGDGERSFVLLSAGNLATTQGVLTALERDIKSGNQPNLATVADLEEAAECIGHASTEEQKKHHRVRAEGDEFLPEATFIFGGQIAGERPAIFIIYPQGNFVRASEDAPFLQVGETKYGKPILDRVITHSTDFHSAVKCALVSMDSTLRSNATVGPPIEVLVYPRDSLGPGLHRILTEDDPYLAELKRAWSENIRQAFDALPSVPDIDLPTASVTSITR